MKIGDRPRLMLRWFSSSHRLHISQSATVAATPVLTANNEGILVVTLTGVSTIALEDFSIIAYSGAGLCSIQTLRKQSISYRLFCGFVSKPNGGRYNL